MIHPLFLLQLLDHMAQGL